MYKLIVVLLTDRFKLSAKVRTFFESSKYIGKKMATEGVASFFYSPASMSAGVRPQSYVSPGSGHFVTVTDYLTPLLCH